VPPTGNVNVECNLAIKFLKLANIISKFLKKNKILQMLHLNSPHIFACYYTVVPWHQGGF
jgi:hypothetical protein